MPDTNLGKCRFHPIDDRLCPIYEINEILKISEPNATDRKRMLRKVCFKWKRFEILFRKMY